VSVFNAKPVGGYNPVASQLQNNKPSLAVAQASPGIYASALQTGLNDQEKRQIDSWAIVSNKHKELMSMSNEAANRAYRNLDVDTRGLLDAYYGVDYSRRPEGAVSSVSNKIFQGEGNDGISVGDAIKSPLRGVFALGEGYGRVVNSYGKAAMLGATNQEVKLDESFNGEAIFNPEYTQPLIEKYGGQRAFVAMGLLKGMTPGEIMDSWGPNDAAMLDAVGEIFDNEPQFTEMINEFEKAQLSPGRYVGHKLHESLNWKQENHPDWMWRLGTGAIDLTYQLAIDPMTYLTFGVGSAARMGITKAGRAEKLIAGAGGVAKHFARQDVQDYWTGFSKGLGEYQDAVKAGQTSKATELRMGLKDKYHEYASDETIEMFTSPRPNPATGQTLSPITDLKSAEDFFTAAENTSLLIRGRVSGLKYMREGLATMQRGRNIKTGARLRTREFFKGKQDFKDLDDQSLDEIVEGVFNIGKEADGVDANAVMKLIEDKKKKGIQGKIDYLSARHPGNKPIYSTDERYAETLDLVREQALIATGDKRFAEAFIIKFANLDEKGRIALRRGLDEATMRRMGVDKVSKGEEFMKKILDQKYAIAGGFSVTDQLVVPARGTLTGELGVTIPVNGTLLPFQNTDALGALPWTEIKHFMAGKTLEKAVGQAENGNKAQILPELIGGAFNNRHADMLTDVWTTFTLAPRLGIRTAIDEGLMFSLYMTTGLAKEFLNAKRAGNVLAAATGSKRAVGPVKNSIQAALSKFPGINVGAVRAISPDEKLVLKGKYEDQAARGEIEFFEIDDLYHEELLDVAIDRVGKNLPDTHKRWLKEAVRGNLKVVEDASASQLAEAISGTRGAVLPEQSLQSASQMTQSLKSWRDPNNPLARATVTDDYILKEAEELEADKLYLAMFHNFVTAFATKPYKLANDKYLSPAGIFFRHNGLQTADEWTAARLEFMEGIGFKATDDGTFILVDEELATQFLKQSRQNLTDATPIHKVASDFADATFAELTHRFHGSAENINSEFVTFMNSQVTEKGLPIPPFKIAADLDFDTYKKLVGENTAELIRTPIDFGPRTTNLAAWATRYGMDKIFSAMTRTTDDLFRQPVVHAHYFMYRKQYEPLQETYKSQLAEGMKAAVIAEGRTLDDKAIARIDKRSATIAQRYFTEHAMEDAVHHTLKFSDNPDVRTIFSHNVRTVGRFYRAVEDFHRRMYRMVSEHGLDMVYRTRLMNQGLSAIGSVHQDENGEKYIVLPMDDSMFHAVDSVLSLYPGWQGSGVSQPLFNDITFKFSAGNPSFQDDAGVPYLSGPMASLSVMGVQAFMNKFNLTKEASANIDNALLGNLGDNMDLKKAVVPRSLSLLWGLMSYDEQNQQEVTATMQAIAYNQANGYGIYPEDFIKTNAAGEEVMDQNAYLKALSEYQKNTQIAAHNLLWLRNVLGLISPISPQLQETKDLPDYLKDVGLTSMKSSFFDVLDDIERMYPAAQDPYELTLATWTGKNRGKLAYIPGRNEQNVVMSYTGPMQDWLLQNQRAVDMYGSAAVMFAPRMGEFSPGVYNWAKAADLINLKTVEDYLEEVVLQDAVNAYFDLDDEENANLSGVANPSTRRQIMAVTTEKKRIMQIQIPMLEQRLRNMADNEEKTKFLNNVYQVANDPEVTIDQNTRDSVNNAYSIYEKFLYEINLEPVREASNSSEIKRTLKTQAMFDLQELADQDESGIVKELIRNSFKGLMNAKVRDAQNTIK
jgi:hypothetical protein